MAAISIEAKDPGRMHLLLTPLPIQENTDRDIRQLVQRTADQIGPHSVEKTLTLQPIQGPEAKGYYFKATDPAPKSGEFRFMYQGIVAAGSALVTFTVLYNGGAEGQADAALLSVRGLKLKAKGSQRPNNAFERPGVLRGPRLAAARSSWPATQLNR